MPQVYIVAVKASLASSFIVESFAVVEEWVQPDSGYIRVRVRLRNGDFVEAAEYFTVQKGRHMTVRYSYQWMDAERSILRRHWDNVAHHPGLENFPHHIHQANGEIVPGRSLSILELLELLESQ